MTTERTNSFFTPDHLFKIRSGFVFCHVADVNQVHDRNCSTKLSYVKYIMPYHKMHSDLYLCEIPPFGRKHIFFSWQFDPITYIRAPGLMISKRQRDSARKGFVRNGNKSETVRN